MTFTSLSCGKSRRSWLDPTSVLSIFCFSLSHSLSMLSQCRRSISSMVWGAQQKINIPLLFLYRSTIRNRHANPSSDKHTALNSHQMPIKRSWRNTKIWAICRFGGCRTCANRHFLENKSPRGSCLLYIYALQNQTTGFIIEIHRSAPKPLHSRTAVLLGHNTVAQTSNRYMRNCQKHHIQTF